MSKQSNNEYPPVRFNTKRLETALLHARVTVPHLATLLEISPLTAQRYVRGCDIPLTQAYRIAELVKVAVPLLWRPL